MVLEVIRIYFSKKSSKVLIVHCPSKIVKHNSQAIVIVKICASSLSFFLVICMKNIIIPHDSLLTAKTAF